ncbi:LacI family DNA-binding transcriptional regulator [Streptomyces hirsutus]
MVNLAEDAQHAGVSASTVSYVLSGKRSISTNNRQRVEESIRELGYHPNAGARALASSRSNIIALMIPLRTDMYVPVMMEIAIAVPLPRRAPTGTTCYCSPARRGPTRCAASRAADWPTG